MFRVIKRSRSMRDGSAGHAGGDTAHGPSTHVDGEAAPFEPGPVSGTNQTDATGSGVQNADLPPVRFPDGRNPYLDRPLPPPPPPKAAPSISVAMPPRPSTSSGPSAKASVVLGLSDKPSFNKRLSKDDMFLTSQTGSKRGLRLYRIGVRGGLPTPEPSPEMRSPMATSSAIPTRMHTPESLTSGEIQIGMALGSPSHLPGSYSGWQPRDQPVQSFQSSQAETAWRPQAPLSPEQMPLMSAPAPQRQKTQRRKLFGGLFGSKKHAEPAKPVETISYAPALVSSPSQQSSHDESIPARSNTVTDRRPLKHKPIIITRSDIEATSDLPPEETRNVSSNSINTEPTSNPLQPKDDYSGYTGTAAPYAPSSLGTSGPSLFLDVEIPSIKMERYSVMFDSLLNPQGTSALLARRQATLEKLKTINDRIAQEEEERRALRQRRATSPQPIKSPGLALFPRPEAPQGASPLTPRRLMRSNTSPALLHSPSKPSFEREHHHHARRERKTVTIVSPRSQDHQRNQAGPPSHEQEKSQPSAAETDFRFGPGDSGLTLGSPERAHEGSYLGIGIATTTSNPIPASMPLRPARAEPQWQMLSPPPSSSIGSTISSTTASRRSPSSSASSIRTHVTRPSVDVDATDDEAESALKTAVEISIARQISISRQQRTLLHPVKTTNTPNPAGSAGQPNSASPLPGRAGGAIVGLPPRVSPSNIRKVTLGQNERVAETRFATPTLVAESGEGTMAQNRKSERVVLEGGVVA